MSSKTPLSNSEIKTKSATLARLVRRLLPSDLPAEDVVQDTWVTALEKTPSRVRNFDGWLWTVAKYNALRQGRRDRQRKGRETYFARSRDLVFDDEYEEEDVDILRLRRAVAELSEPYRSVIELKYLHGLTAQQVADRLGRPTATVRSQIGRALQKLREKLVREEMRERKTGGLFAVLLRGLWQLPGRSFSLTPTSVAAVGAAAALLTTFVLLKGEPSEKNKVLAGFGGPADVSRANVVSQRPTRGLRRRIPELPAVAVIDSAELTVLALQEGTGEPVSGLTVVVEPEDEARGASEFPTRRRAETDVDGAIVRADLTAGRWTIAPMRGEPVTVELEPGQKRILTLTIPTGVVVQGLARVRTIGGVELFEPVPQADIWVSWPGRIDQARKVTVTGPDGRFTVENVDPSSWVYAEKPGQGRSFSCALNTPGLQRDSIMLRLLPPGKPVRGVVRDEFGLPIEGARVTLRPRSGPKVVLRRYRTEHGARDYHGLWLFPAYVPDVAFTGADGSFELDERPSRSLPLFVTAAGKLPSLGSSWADSDRSLDITLHSGLTLRGRCLDEDGAPLSGVEVEVAGVLEPARVFTEEDGSFRLRGLPSSGLTLRARSLDTNPPAAALLGLEEPRVCGGGVEGWDEVRLVLDSRLNLTGVALDEEGKPLADWVVMAVPEMNSGVYDPWVDLMPYGPEPGLRTRTREDGSFVFAGCAEEPYFVRLFPPEGTSVPAHAWQHHVQPGGEPLLLLVEPQNSPSAEIAGTLDLPAAVREGAVAVLNQLSLGIAERGELDAEGNFTFGPIHDGIYELGVWLPGWGSIQLAKGRLERGQSLSLGRIPVPALGTLRAHVRFGGGVDKRTLTARILSRYLVIQGTPEFAEHGILVEADGTVLCEELLPGDYELQLIAKGGQLVQFPFTIEDGLETLLEVALPSQARSSIASR